MLNIYHIEKQNYVNGNGCRYVLWLQGCDLECIGCWNKKTWSFEKNILKSVDEIFEDIKSIEDKIDGITFTGGEPFLQSKELSKLARNLKIFLNKNIQIFTGFEKKELDTNDHLELLKFTDILISGRYDNTIENNNQKVYLLNEQVKAWEFNNSDIEIDIDENGDIMLSGYPTNDFINNIKEL